MVDYDMLNNLVSNKNNENKNSNLKSTYYNSINNQ